MQLAGGFAVPFVFASTIICLLVHLAFRSLRPASASGRQLPPGPRGFPLLGALPLIGPAPHSGLAALARKYGPVMYLKMGTSGVVVASSPSAAKTFLKVLDAPFANRPVMVSVKDVSYGCQNMVFANPGPKWALMRKLSTVHLLGSRAIADWARVRYDEAGHVVRGIAEAVESGRPSVVVSEVLVCAFVNIVGQITVSKRLFDVQGDESNSYKDMIMELLTGVGLFNISDFVPSVAWMDLQGVQAKLRRIHDNFDGLITKLLAEHAANAEERAREGRLDFVDKLRASKDDEDGESITDINIRALVFDMFAAGTDTSAIIVEWAMSEMINNPSIMARMQEEMDRVVGRGRRLEESDIANLPYLQAVCKEAIRLHPSTPLSLPHFSFEECEVEGYHVPANTRLLVNIWAIGRDPESWEDPLEFRPERFLSGSTAKVDPMGNYFELIPFGAGRRICVGKMVGMLFVQYFLGTLVHAFDWRLPDGEETVDMAETFGLGLPKAVPLRAIVTPRLMPAAYA